MYFPKTSRRKGVHKFAPTAIPKAPKIGGAIKTPAFPKLPKLKVPTLPTTHTNKGRY